MDIGPDTPVTLDPRVLEVLLGSWRSQIDGALDVLLPLEGTADSALAEGMRYAVLAGPGKRFRPLLCILAARACGGEGSRALPTACAIELLHACSLVQDDLPAMDHGTLRRGLPSCHVRYGEALTILVGDALLAMALELVVRQRGAGLRPDGVMGVGVDLPPERVLALLQVLTGALGPLGLPAGQAADLASEGRDIDPDTLVRIHTRKTGALVEAAVVCGALVAGADTPRVEALARYGAALGRLYQIVDDILSETGDGATLGKDPGSDRARRKATYPRLYGLAGAQQAADDALAAALGALTPFDHEAEPLRALAIFARARRH